MSHISLFVTLKMPTCFFLFLPLQLKKIQLWIDIHSFCMVLFLSFPVYKYFAWIQKFQKEGLDNEVLANEITSCVSFCCSCETVFKTRFESFLIISFVLIVEKHGGFRILWSCGSCCDETLD